MPKRAIHWKHYFLFGINPVIKFLIISDVLYVGATGLLGPIFALFIEDYIVDGGAAVAGVAAAIYLFTKSVMQIPIAAVIDRIRGEKDDYFVLCISTFLMALVPLLYLVVTLPWHLYVVEFILGLVTAFSFPSYMAIFTRHIDHHQEGLEWGVYFTLVDFSSAALAAIGGYLASTWGFRPLIILVVIISLVGSFLLWPLKSFMRKNT